MVNETSENTEFPKFTWLAGVGAIVVYLMSSFPFVLSVAFFKLANTSNSQKGGVDLQLQDILSDITKDPWVLLGALLVQCISLFVYAYLLSVLRGTKNPFNDFGIRFTKSSFWFFPVGIAIQFLGVGLAIPLQLIRGSSTEQDIATTFRSSSGIAFALIMVLVVLVVPFAEELCFRGIFQRGLSKYLSPVLTIAIVGSIFASIHLADPGALIGGTTLFIVGIATSALAQHRGRIDASIFLHVGFNFTTAFFFVLSRFI